MANKTVLVTGAAGHLGNNLVRALSGRGDRVRAGVREPRGSTALDAVDCEIVPLDLLQPASLRPALEGVDVLYQVGAVFRHWARDPERDIYRANLQGTRNVVEAALRAGVGRIVYVSSLGAADHASTPITESGWNADRGNVYYRSKVDSERLALDLCRREGLPLVTLLPGAMVGPNCFRLTPTMALLEMVLSGRLPADAGFKFNFVDVEDVAEACMLAAKHGRPGERYLLANERPSDIPEIVRVAQWEYPQQNIRMPARPPRALLYLAALAMEAGAALRGREPSLRRRYLSDFTQAEVCDCAKAHAQLGFAPRPPAEALARAFRWLAGHSHHITPGRQLQRGAA